MIPKEYEKYEKVVTVSAVNFTPVWGNKAANLDKIKTVVAQAARIGSNFVAFPELALSGYECGEETLRDKKPCAMHVAAAESIPGPSTEEIARLGREFNIYVLMGIPECDASDRDVRYISVAVIGPEGVLGRYRKLVIAPPSDWAGWTKRICGFRPGNDLPVFKTRFGPIGVQVCADLSIVPEYTRILCHKGARIIFNCSGSDSGPGKIERLLQVTATRGSENFVYVVSANLVGKERTVSYCGHSCIAGASFPRATQVFAEGGDSEEIVSATLSFDNLHYWWTAADPKRLTDLELVAEEYRKLVDHSKNQTF